MGRSGDRSWNRRGALHLHQRNGFGERRCQRHAHRGLHDPRWRDGIRHGGQYRLRQRGRHLRRHGRQRQGPRLCRGLRHRKLPRRDGRRDFPRHRADSLRARRQPWRTRHRHPACLLSHALRLQLRIRHERPRNADRQFDRRLHLRPDASRHDRKLHVHRQHLLHAPAKRQLCVSHLQLRVSRRRRGAFVWLRRRQGIHLPDELRPDRIRHRHRRPHSRRRGKCRL